VRACLSLLVAVLLVPGLIGVFAWYEIEAHIHHNRGHAFYKSKQYDEAAAEYGRAIAWSAFCSVGTVADWYCDRGDAHDMADQLDAALADYAEAIKRKPYRSRYSYERAIAYRRHKRYKEAVAEMDRAITLQTGRPEYFLERADSLIGLGEYRKAIADLDHYRAKAITEPYGRDYRSYDLRGWAHYKLQEYPQALADLSQALKIKPDYALAWHDRGDVEAALGRPTAAASDYERARHFGYK
jgi:tetratricopeptide (TPR) repeat protein